MLERFTDRARRVVVLAQQEARVLGHDYLGAAHILLGLIDEGEGTAVRALESLGISLEVVRQQVEEIIGQGQQVRSGHIPFTPRAKKVLELSLREALQLGDDYTGTEHVLLGLIREGEDVAAQVLVKLGADLDRVRLQVIQLLHGSRGKESADAPTAPPERAKPPAAARVNAIGSRLSSVWQRVGVRPGTGGLGQRPSGTVPVALVGVRVEQQSDQPVVVLKEVSGNRYLPIWVGPVEATAIAFAQEGRKSTPPLTHELLRDVLATMGIQLLNVTISTLIDGIFDCHIFFSNHRTVEARPSDAIALALRAGAPILIDAELLDEAGVSIADDGSLSGFRLRGAGTTRSRARQPERRSHIGRGERRFRSIWMSR